MNVKQTVLIGLLIPALVSISTIAAPLDQTTSENSSNSTITTTPSTSASNDNSTATTTPTPSSSTENSANTTSTQSLVVSGGGDPLTLNHTSFTCYGRMIGYYADEEHDCKAYHFCLLGEFNGESVYQRITYLCLNDSVFDQQALDCVPVTKTTTPCKQSHDHYELSNKLLRQAIVGKGIRDNQTHPTNETTST